VRIQCLYFEAKRGPRAKMFGKHWYRWQVVLHGSLPH